MDEKNGALKQELVGLYQGEYENFWPVLTDAQVMENKT